MLVEYAKASPNDVLIRIACTNTSTATAGRGLGASHQTGWTALVANLLELVANARAA